ncbi:nucleotidyl transferase AbiEii/AbiGii toxin family protein [Burkholderia vietnamiensis]|uniref:nucleotidyl transferase AbiEii/AbiGii toxin family protein n=1 Tax=Burkholderia vietnamiensis TaxID=60552 RepID=UPI001D13CC2D|nr:nucleotidyl transferase AbiEii/AbiGii toxin family protein [Burkholderia vietnamiensis]UEC01689.1 nucleotidyl transferase AbiEii/AbiGii toxin family protein [Burkholderia vietnamiensis]
MRVLPPERLELIDALAAEAGPGGITAGLLEKDEHLTEALRALFALRPDGMQLVLCGGTSLSKAHRLIERMSEDADLKVVVSDAILPSKSEVRRCLSDLKALVSETLAGVGLVEDKVRGQAFNANHYFCSEWSYGRHYASAASLRPHLQIELTARIPVLKTVTCQVGNLVDLLAGREGTTFDVETVVAAETMAEKVLSFLRRYAQHRAGLLRQDWDTALVRHLYDVRCIHLQQPDALAEARQVFPALVAGDQKEFGTQFADFAAAAYPVLSGALKQARSDAKIQTEFTSNLLPLIYGGDIPTFEQSFGDFETVASAVLETLR